MLSITKHTNFHFWPGNVGQLHGPTETLVLLRVVVLESDLELNGLGEIALLLLSICSNYGDGFPQGLTLKLTVEI